MKIEFDQHRPFNLIGTCLNMTIENTQIAAGVRCV